MKKDTSWGNVAQWYKDHVVSEDSYHRKVVLPNLLRLMNIKVGSVVLDVACGSGFFAHEFSKLGAQVTGTDISKELIAFAKEQYENKIQSKKEVSDVHHKSISFHVTPAHDLSVMKDQSVDSITIILAIQNIAEVKETLTECHRVLKQTGKLYIVMNHPAYRIPGSSSWGFDEKDKKQYRRVDQYLTEKKIPIVMHPGSNPSETTISFHRPLQYYMKLIGNNGFAVTRLEEWISHKASEQGPRQAEEDRMRKEIPLFMALEIIKQH